MNQVIPERDGLVQEVRQGDPTGSFLPAAYGLILLRRPLRTLLVVPILIWGLGCHSLNLLSRERNESPTSKEAIERRTAGLPNKYSFRIPPYVFQSDYEIQKTQPLFVELAQLRDQVYKELLLPQGSAQVQVYLFEDRERYERFMHIRYPELPPRRAFFVAQPRALGGSEDLLVYTYRSDRIRQDLRHELTHALLHSVIKEVPLWLDEGLAEYFELPPEAQGVNASHVEHLRRALAGSVRPDLARLEGLDKVDDMNPAEYREAWAWVHLMLRSKPEAKTLLLSYLQQLRGLRHPGPLRYQLIKVFPDLQTALVDHINALPVGPRLEARAHTPEAKKLAISLPPSPRAKALEDASRPPLPQASGWSRPLSAGRERP